MGTWEHKAILEGNKGTRTPPPPLGDPHLFVLRSRQLNATCLPSCLTEKSCFHGDSIHKPWERFADESCTGWCICNGRTGHVGCVSLCPPRGLPMCPPGKLPEVIEEPSADPTGTCKCRRKSCSPRLNLPPPPPPVKLPEEHGKLCLCN